MLKRSHGTVIYQGKLCVVQTYVVSMKIIVCMTETMQKTHCAKQFSKHLFFVVQIEPSGANCFHVLSASCMHHVVSMLIIT